MLKFGFFDSINGDRKYNTRDISEMFDGIILDGVFMYVGDHFVVKPKANADDTPSMMITVGTGQAWFNHTKVINTTKIEFEVPQAITKDLSLAVVLEIDEEERNGNIILMYDYDPKNLINNEFLHQYNIATITVPIGTINITDKNIENHVGVDLPYVKGPNEYLDDDEIMKHWDATWKSFYQECNDAWRDFMSSSTNTFSQNFDEWQKQIDESIKTQVGRMDEIISTDQKSFDTFMSNSDQTFETNLSNQKKEYNEFMADAQSTLNDAKEIVKAGVGGIRYMGSIPFEDLPSGDDVKEGYLYNITNNFTTDDRFIEGPGHKFVAGTDVCYTKDGKWNIFALSENMQIQLPLSVENGGTGAKNGEEGYINLSNEISLYNAEITDSEQIIIQKTYEENEYKPRKILFGLLWNWIKKKIDSITLSDLDSVNSNIEKGKLIDALSLKESDQKHGGVTNWIVDDQTGEITGYQTKAGADTVFPFSRGVKYYDAKYKDETRYEEVTHIFSDIPIGKYLICVAGMMTGGTGGTDLRKLKTANCKIGNEIKSSFDISNGIGYTIIDVNSLETLTVTLISGSSTNPNFKESTSVIIFKI